MSLKRRSIGTGCRKKHVSGISFAYWYTTLFPAGHLHITDLLQPVATMSSRHPVLRSATTDSLYVPRTRQLFGEWAFWVAAPKMWNQLPYDVRSTENTNTFKNKNENFYEYNFFTICDSICLCIFHMLICLYLCTAVEYLTVCICNCNCITPTVASELPGFCFFCSFFILPFLVPCARLSWLFRPLWSARKYTILYHISYRV